MESVGECKVQQLKVINVVTRVYNAHDCSTGCNQLKPVFEQFWNIFETWQLTPE